MNRKKTLALVMCLLLALVMAAAACGDADEPSTTSGAGTTAGSSTTTGAPPTTAAPGAGGEAKTLKIGASASLNGPMGIASKNWLELYAKMTNDAGGLKVGADTYNIEFVVYDDQGDATKSADNCKRAVLDDGVKFWLAGQAAAPPMEIAITDPAKVINIGYDITGAGAKPGVGYYWTVGGFFNSGLMYRIQKDVVAEGVKSYVSVKPDNEMGHFADMGLNNVWKLSGPDVEALGTVFVNPATVDFSAVATKAISSNPDCVDLAYLGLIPNSVPQMYRALADAGFKGIILPGIMSQDELDQLVQAVGKEIVEGGECPSYDTSSQTDNRMRQFLDAYEQTYGGADITTTNVMDEMLVLEDALVRAGSIDADAVKAVLDEGNHPVQSLLGKIQLFVRVEIDPSRASSAGGSNPIARIVDGKLTNFSFATVKDQYLVTVAANNLVEAYKPYWEQQGYPTFPESEKAQSTMKWSDIGITGQD
ncbi:MAG: ABC transporter substrate-binding protein [Thermoleophilia bacterium]|nr:ABC transporter substrate-binding protein [Thermoleophilia bacterium]